LVKDYRTALSLREHTVLGLRIQGCAKFKRSELHLVWEYRATPSLIDIQYKYSISSSQKLTNGS
jgi:hypothetical protein